MPLRPLAAAAIMVLIGLLLVTSLPEAAAKVRHFYPWDLVVDWNGAQSWIEGEDIYDPAVLERRGLAVLGGIGHPPTTFFWFLPFAGTGLLEARDALALMVVFLLTIHVLLVFLELRVPNPLLFGSLAVAWVFATHWFADHLYLGQISELIALAYVGAWLLLRRGHETAAGVVLGLATTLKLFPGLLVVFLLLTRRWRGFAAACLAYFAVAAVMTARFGWSAWLQFFTQQGEITRRWIMTGRNGSVQGIVHRLVDRHCDGNTFHLTAAWLAAAAAVAVVVAALAFVVALRRRGEDLDVAFALLSIVSFFANVWVWEHYNVLMILPIAVAAERLWRGGDLPRRFRAAGGALIAASLVMLSRNDPTSQDPSKIAAAMTTTWGHIGLHLDEVGRWLPFVLTLAVLACLLARAPRRDVTLEPETVPAPPSTAGRGSPRDCTAE